MQSTIDLSDSTNSRTSVTSAADTVFSSPGSGSRSKRSDSITSWNSVSRDTLASSPASLATGTTSPGPQLPNGSTVSLQMVNSNSQEAKPVVYDRIWEMEMENLLKDMYTAIKSQQILQPLDASRPSVGSLSPGNTMMRNRSLRGGQPDRLATLKRGSIRGLQSIIAQQGASPYSSNSSIDGRVSPSPSFATSTHEVRISTAGLPTSANISICSSMPPVHQTSCQHLVSLPTCRIPLSVKHKKMILEARTVTLLIRLRLALLTKSLLFSVPRGLRRVSCAENSTGNAQASGPRIRLGWTFSLSSRRAC
jgi:hypothetical protein